jgi:hypothetical protein
MRTVVDLSILGTGPKADECKQTTPFETELVKLTQRIWSAIVSSEEALIIANSDYIAIRMRWGY